MPACSSRSARETGQRRGARDLQQSAYLSRILKRFKAEEPDRDDARPRRPCSQLISVTDQGHQQFQELGKRSNDQITERFNKLAAGERGASSPP